MTYNMDDVERLYLLKRSKYNGFEITDELDEVLFKEALRETIAANHINNGFIIVK